MAVIDRKWAERIVVGDRRALVSQFRHEAGELHQLLSSQDPAVPPGWRDFRRFLADVGPSPGPAHHLQRIVSKAAWCGDNVAWVLKPKELKAPPPAPPPSPDSSYLQWTMIAGMPIDCADLPARLRLSFASISSAAAAGCSLDELAAESLRAAPDLEDLRWFSRSSAHQQAFRDAYMAWRLRVDFRNRDRAKPKFLYLYMLVPAMTRAKAALDRVGLWRPSTPRAQAERDIHPAWRQFNELLPKAQAMAAEFEPYRAYSVGEDIDALCGRITADEAHLRATPQSDAA